MMQIAVVALAPGQCGFYDDLSGIHLSLTNREAKINQGVNTAGLINAVMTGKITVVSGSLGSEAFSYKEANMAIPTYYRLLEKKKKKMLKNKIVRAVEISEHIKKETKEEVKEILETPTEVKVDVIIEEVVTENTEEIINETVEETKEVPVIEEVPAPKKRSRKKKETAEKEE